MIQAGDEVALCGTTHLYCVADALPKAPALLVIEQSPLEWLDAEARARCLRFERFVAGDQLAGRTRGCIFSEAFECRWQPGELNGDAVRIRYIGAPIVINELAPLPALDLSALQARELSYDLWGERVDDPAAVGEPSSAVVYAELRLPRLLLYPTEKPCRRVRLRVQEYLDATGRVVLSRFRGLDEEA
jgi:hypothetical protein